MITHKFRYILIWIRKPNIVYRSITILICSVFFFIVFSHTSYNFLLPDLIDEVENERESMTRVVKWRQLQSTYIFYSFFPFLFFFYYILTVVVCDEHSSLYKLSWRILSVWLPLLFLIQHIRREITDVAYFWTIFYF